MPSHPLLPDTIINLSATLAATIGLEEAILLSVLNNVANLQQQKWARLNANTLRRQLPFWNDDKIHLVMQSLLDKGLLSFNGPIFPQAEGIIYSFGDTPAQAIPTAAAAATAVATPVAPELSGKPLLPLAADWQPTADTLRLLGQHGIEASFALSLLATFILQEREKGQSRSDWNTRFFNHVKSQAVFAQNDAQRHSENRGFNPEPEQDTPMYAHWQPRPDAVEILIKGGIEPSFIEDTVAEFVLYWSERGDVGKTWNSKFVNHVRRQWEFFIATAEHANKPTRIDEQWQPSADCFDIINMAHIDRGFAEALVPEFILYWKDSNQVQTGWNSRFLQYVKQQWAKRLSTGDSHGSTATQPSYTTAQGSIQRLTDTSWAK